MLSNEFHHNIKTSLTLTNPFPSVLDLLSWPTNRKNKINSAHIDDTSTESRERQQSAHNLAETTAAHEATLLVPQEGFYRSDSASAGPDAARIREELRKQQLPDAATEPLAAASGSYWVPERGEGSLLRSVDRQVFAVVAALSQRVVALDPWVRRCIRDLDFGALHHKLRRAKEMFYCNDPHRTVRCLASDCNLHNIFPSSSLPSCNPRTSVIYIYIYIYILCTLCCL